MRSLLSSKYSRSLKAMYRKYFHSSVAFSLQQSGGSYSAYFARHIGEKGQAEEKGRSLSPIALSFQRVSCGNRTPSPTDSVWTVEITSCSIFCTEKKRFNWIDQFSGKYEGARDLRLMLSESCSSRNCVDLNKNCDNSNRNCPIRSIFYQKFA